MAKESDLNKVENDSLLNSFEPTDYTDVGQGHLLAEAYKHRLAFCEGMGWLTYKDGIWVQSDIDAQGYSQKLTILQLQEAMCKQLSNLKQGASTTPREDPYISYARTRRSTARIAATIKNGVTSFNDEIPKNQQTP